MRWSDFASEREGGSVVMVMTTCPRLLAWYYLGHVAS